MKTVSFALIGDIHYPDHKSASRFVDQKDVGMSARIVSRIAPDKLKTVSDVLRQKLINDSPIQAVLLCGDFTSRGDKAGYGDCLAYLKDVLDLSNKTFWMNRHLHVVPGNHDISRAEVDLEDDDVFKKFADMKDAWLALGRDEMQPSEVRTTDTTSGSGVARIFSVNSCVGCGERRSLAPDIKKALREFLEKYVATATPDDAFELMGEQLDSPAIDESHLAKIEQEIGTLAAQTGVPVILAHHGLLPQTIPRLQIYSELLNSGRVRFSLASHKRPIIYCHGHLHEDPIEIVSVPQDSFGKIIVISAPLFIDGFNVITLEFNNAGIAMGCVVARFRFDKGSVLEKEPARISLLSQPPTIEDGSTLRFVLTATTQTTQRFPQLLDSVKKLSSPNKVGDSTLSDALRELEWMGLIEIKNRNGVCRHWQVRRIAP